MTIIYVTWACHWVSVEHSGVLLEIFRNLTCWHVFHIWYLKSNDCFKYTNERYLVSYSQINVSMCLKQMSNIPTLSLSKIVASLPIWHSIWWNPPKQHLISLFSGLYFMLNSWVNFGRYLTDFWFGLRCQYSRDVQCLVFSFFLQAIIILVVVYACESYMKNI